jgi:hypothetical protein
VPLPFPRNYLVDRARLPLDCRVQLVVIAVLEQIERPKAGQRFPTHAAASCFAGLRSDSEALPEMGPDLGPITAGKNAAGEIGLT